MFHLDHHKCLLGEESDFLCALLLPLAGPESFTDEENDQLPLDCQYLPDDKVREDNPDLRKKLLESLLKVSFNNGDVNSKLFTIAICIDLVNWPVCDHTIQEHTSI